MLLSEFRIISSTSFANIVSISITPRFCVRVLARLSGRLLRSAAWWPPAAMGAMATTVVSKRAAVAVAVSIEVSIRLNVVSSSGKGCCREHDEHYDYRLCHGIIPRAIATGNTRTSRLRAKEDLPKR